MDRPGAQAETKLDARLSPLEAMTDRAKLLKSRKFQHENAFSAKPCAAEVASQQNRLSNCAVGHIVSRRHFCPINGINPAD